MLKRCLSHLDDEMMIFVRYELVVGEHCSSPGPRDGTARYTRARRASELVETSPLGLFYWRRVNPYDNKALSAVPVSKSSSHCIRLVAITCGQREPDITTSQHKAVEACPT